MKMDVLMYFHWFCVIFVVTKNNMQAEAKDRSRLKNKYRPHYHITVPYGVLRQPSAFAYFMDQYHIFYEYKTSTSGYNSTIMWGHYASENLIQWNQFPPAIAPENFYEIGGILSGSAVTYDNSLTLFYTGKASHKNKTYNTQNAAFSRDGNVFSKYEHNPIIKNSEKILMHNPKVWKDFTGWFMLLGSSSKNSKTGEMLFYTSKDKYNWKYGGTLKSYGDMGYWWENPDYFTMEGQHILIFTARGIQPEPLRFRNEYQTGYVIFTYDYSRRQLKDVEISTATFHELDSGHDFSAVQTLLAADGRRLLVGYLGMPDENLLESSFGWGGMLTLVRELKFSCQGKMLMNPVQEVEYLRDGIVEHAWYYNGDVFFAGSKSFELLVNTSSVTSSTEAMITLEWEHDHQYVIKYTAEFGMVSVDRGGLDGVRKAFIPVSEIFRMRIFVDVSSVEVFCGDGDAVFTSRVYFEGSLYVRIGGNTELYITQYRMKRGVRHQAQFNYTMLRP